MITARPLKLTNRVDTSTRQVLPADPDIIKYDISSLPAEIMETLILQDIGGIEFIMLARHDKIVGKNTDTSQIYNLNDINLEFNPKTLNSLGSSVRGSKYELPLSRFVDEETTTVTLEREWITITLQDIPYGYSIEVTAEVSSDSITWQ